MRSLIVDDSSTMRRNIVNTRNKLGHQNVSDAGNGHARERRGRHTYRLSRATGRRTRRRGCRRGFHVRPTTWVPSVLEGPVQYHHDPTAITTHGRLPDPHSEFCVLNYRRSGSGTLDRMQLRSARLCLDCDEVHDAQQCPQCASETFAFITRWVPIPDRPDRPVKRSRGQEVASPDTLGAYQEMLLPQQQQGGKWRTVRRGAMGLALFGIAGWLWRHSSKPPGEDEAAGEETTNHKGT
jgi:hypothetical protein